MNQDCLCQQTSTIVSTTSVRIREREELADNHRLNASINIQRQLSMISQIYSPYGSEYYPQKRAPPTGPEGHRPFVLTILEDEQISGGKKRLSIINQVDQPTDEETNDQDEEKKLNKKTRRILFILEPIISGLILFPIIALFWQCGWNLVVIVLDHFNQTTPNLHLNRGNQEEFKFYKWELLAFACFIGQISILFFYLFQDFIYNCLKKRIWIVKIVFLKVHIFLLATIYIIQYKIFWVMWDQVISHRWDSRLAFSLISLFALIVFIGHLSDLVCSPFVFSYDSIEYCIHFGCPLLTREMKQWKIILINYILYEIIILNLSMGAWHGFYHLFDDYLYPNDPDMSAGICLIIGYVLYFPLMYFQKYLEELNLKYEFWTFVSINFPQFYRNIRHLLAFFSCMFVWRGYWLFYDSYIEIFEDRSKTYILLYMVSFVVLSIIGTSSTTNGPLSNIKEKNNFFPLYPHCYVSIVQRKCSRFFSSKAKTPSNNE